MMVMSGEGEDDTKGRARPYTTIAYGIVGFGQEFSSPNFRVSELCGR